MNAAAAAPATLHYRVEAAEPQAHLFRITLTVMRPQAPQQVSLPVWIPGSYLVREFSRHLQRLSARQNGKLVPVRQLGKASWQVECAPSSELVLCYEVYANDPSVRSAWLDSRRAFFNGTSLFLQVHGQEASPHTLELVPTPAQAQWEVATGLSPLKAGKRGFGTYAAGDYDELVDCPVEMGTFWRGRFKAGGVPHALVVDGAAESFDSARLLADTQTLCETQMRFWHAPTPTTKGSKPARRSKPPFGSYLFLLHAADDGYGGLEHRNSTALIACRRDLPRLGETRMSEGYTTLLGLISHEYFHTWNVKQLKPAEFARYDYSGENHTELLWFFEGFTSYYDDLLLRRAGLIDDATYLRLLNKTVNQVLQTPGREVQSVAQASFDAWVKYYRPDENTPNATVSYYTKGALVALCFDLTLRAEGRTTLDDVMRLLMVRCQGGPMREADFAAALKACGGRSFSREIAAWVHGTRELPLEDLLTTQGLAVLQEPAQLQQRLGLRVNEGAAGIVVKNVLRGTAAEQAGFCAGDEWLGVEVAGQGWRLNRLDDLPLYTAGHRKVVAWVARDRRLVRLDLQLPAAATTWRLALREAPKAQRWLSGSAG